MRTSSIEQQSELTAVDFDPFADGELLLTAPATESQKEIWASVQMGDSANCAYNESQSLRLGGQLNLEAFQSAVQQLVQRHEALRTTFSTDGSTLCIVASLLIDIPVIDMSALELQEQEAKVAALLEQEVEQPFDLEHGPLFRAKIIKLHPQEHLVTLTAHHIICDGWSWGVLMPELGQIYSALHQGVALDLEAGDKFSEYAILQEEEEQSPEAIAIEQYWLDQFSDSVPIVDFPTDRPRPSLRTFNAAREDWHLNAELVTNLKQLGTKFSCSFMTTILAGFEVWLHRLTGHNDLIVGIPAAGQAASGQYNLIGHCVNLLPLRSQINGEKSFSDYLQTRRSTILDAYDHQQFTFGSLVRKLVLPRDSSRIPLVPIIFNIDQGLDSDKLPFAGLEVDFYSNPRSFENFELYINATELRGKLTLECQYNTNLFDADTIRRRMAEFETLLLGIVTNPNETIAQLPLLSADEQNLLAAWNNTTATYPENLCIHQLFEAQVEKTPGAIAVIFEDQQLTYQELNQRANKLAHHLQSLGVKPEVLVGLCVKRSLEMVVGILGILKAGGAYLPLDPDYPSDRLEFMVTDAQVLVLVTQSQCLDILPDFSATKVCLDTDWPVISTLSQENSVSQGTPESLAYVIYTSGSTGKPKGVMVNHGNVTRLFVATQDWFNFNASDVWTLFHSYAFDFSVWEIWGALLHGGRLVIVPFCVSRDPGEFYRLLCREGVTVLNQTPSAFRQLIWVQASKQDPNTQRKEEEKIGLRWVIFGGEALDPSSLLPWFEQHGDCKPQLVNMYGITETTVHVTFRPLTIADAARRSSLIGVPIPDLQVYILDQWLQPVPIGIPGHLYVSGAGLARGYLNRPDLTAERFISYPFGCDSQSLLYKTGDLARYLPNGEIEYLGRIDYQVKIRGFRIELGEVEAAMAQHPAVKEAVAIVQEDSPDEKNLVGYFVPEPNHDSLQLTTDLRRFLKEHLPEFMVPSILMALENMPLTSNNKIDRKALPKPDTSRPELQANYVAPRSPLERQIADIWAQVLNLHRVGIHDNFFELGGYSLLGIQVVSRMRQALQVQILMSNLFELPTVADLAQRVETLRWAAQSVQVAEGETANDYEEGEL